MGLMDKLKAAKNFVTGGGATVTVELNGEARLGASVPVTVTAEIKDAAMKVARVYVILRSQETVSLRHRSHHDRDGDGFADREHVHEAETLHRSEVVLAQGLELAAGSTHTWTGEVHLPGDAQPTYQGKHARHEWQVQAALDVAGNDPDSGWVTFTLR